MTRIYFIFFLLLSFCFEDFAQTKELSGQSLYWTRYYNQLSINKKLTWHNEIDNRRFFQDNAQHHFIMHSRLHTKLSKSTDLGFGITYSRQSPQDPAANSSLVVPEIRPNQEINYAIPFSKRIGIQHRFRIDERFIHHNDGKILTDGYDFNFRFRYRIQANIRLNDLKAKNATTFKLADELMVNAGPNIVYNHFDQNRIYMAVSQIFNKNFETELGYLHWYQQRPTGTQFFARDIARLTLYHKIKL